MKKILKFEVEEGDTKCSQCPEEIRCDRQLIDCKKYDLSTLKFIGEEDAQV